MRFSGITKWRELSIYHGKQGLTHIGSKISSYANVT